MNKLKYQKVIDLIDEDIIKEAEIKTSELSDTENGNAADASGVERYRGIVWRRITAAASAVLLIAGVGTGGALMLKNRPPLLDEVSNVAVTETTEDMGTKAKGSGETAEVTSVGRAAATETDTKESKNTTAAEKDKQPMTDAPREESTETPREENNGEPQEENNEPEGREKVTTGAKTTQLPVLRTTVTKAQTTQKPTTVTTKEPVVYEPTEPVTERPTPEHPPGYIPTLTWNPEDGEWINNMLSSLAYTPWEYDFHVDGRPPEAYVKGSDGNSYELYFTLKAVNRNGRERAPMPDEIYNYFVAQRHECY
ncbi:hypothetical protein [Ruminococcus flavefaciens]|uniref:Uncharacterized protein n=1 Tax=Ruminococcus flavefaciens 007c TaxID=1341157 RepID=W7V0K5_RUMFL|nr:hypothetical protein [Ruminococcus flavefaciens]EWM54560.1 hypothetical protein RF007C_00340 [Ruminococcus flavefaciens 007c]